MSEQKNRSEKYIYKQKDKYMKLINKTQDYQTAFDLASKKGDLAILADFLRETEKRGDFVDSIICNVWKDYATENPGLLTKFAVELGIDELTDRFGTEFGNKLNQAKQNKKLNYLDVQQLLLVNEKSKIAKQQNPNISQLEIDEIKKNESQQLCQLMDLFTDDNLRVGIHRTGGAVSGEQIEQQGLFLTGHMSSGVFEKDSNESLGSTLEKNISFYDHMSNSPGRAIRDICTGGNYKNYYNKENVDIVLVGIPKDVFNNNDKSIISQNGYQSILNPDYVIGHVTVNTYSNTIDSISRNRFRNNDLWKIKNEFNYRDDVVISNDEQKLKKCYEIAKRPENRGIMKRAFDYIKGLARGKEDRAKNERQSLDIKDNQER